MSTGGIFTIITNDGKQDRMLMATAMLSEHLARIVAQNRQRTGVPDPNDVRNLPTLLDIERTHVLFVNAHFKPFAALGFEYAKVNGSAASLASGASSRVTFSIPQFGDFFHDIALHVVITQPSVTVGGGVTASDTPAFRWADFPGERLCRSVEQDVNGNKLDTYSTVATTFHRLYRVAPNKLAGWKKCVGQELPIEGFVSQPGVLTGAGTWTASGTASSSRIAAKVHNGNQTPTLSKSGSLEMFIPLLFWYCKDVRLAVPSIAIPYGQRFINIDLAPGRELAGLVPRGASTWDAPGGTLSDLAMTTCELYVNNIFMNPEVHTIYIRRVGFSLIRVHREQSFPANAATGEQLLQNMKWPIEYMYIGGKVTANFEPSSDGDMRKTMDAWHRFSSYTDTNFRTDGQQVEYLQNLLTGSYTAGVTVTTGAITTSDAAARTAVALAVGDTVRVNGVNVVVNAVGTAGAAGSDPVGQVTFQPAVAIGTGPAFKVTKQGLQVTAKVWTPTLSNLTVKAHGIEIYKQFPAGFFNSYTAYHYGGPNINAPAESDSLFVPFCLYPGTYQPSGHINVSRAREFYLNYESSVFAGSAGRVFVVASALNFLLISDGSAVLRYST